MAKKPNILFFFTDDQRFDTLAALGNEQIHTPNMDKWINRGVAFTHAHIMGGTSGAVCMPSRAMLMTGKTLFHLYRQGQSIPEDHVLLGEHLQAHGYETWGTGKWHNSSSSYARSFTDGDEIFFGGMNDHWNVPANHYDPTGEYPFQPQVEDWFWSNEVSYRQTDHITPGKHSSELFCDAAIEHLRTYDDDKPFFMYLAFMAPHDPRTMPKQYLDMYAPDDIELPPNYMPGHPFDNGELYVRDEKLEKWPRTQSAIRKHLAEYYAMITHADAQMGRVLDALEAAGHAEDTIIVFAGDNGLALGQHGLMGKQNLYDHSVRVPLVMCGPGVPEGIRSRAHCYLLDIYPTLCELIGIEPPDTIDGTSLVPAMQDGDALLRDTLYCGYKELMRSVRDPRFKLIEYVVDGIRTTQLFDLIDDPWELNNLADEGTFANELARLRAEMIHWRDETDDAEDEFGKVFWAGCEI